MTSPDANNDRTVALDVETAPQEVATTSIRSLATLGLVLFAVAFLGWMIVLHPGHQSLFGPAPAPLALAASHAPPPRPTHG